MPQFDTTTFAGQIFWLAFSFGLLYLLVLRVILPKLIQIVDHREDRISQNIRAAKDLQKEIDYLQAKVSETKRQTIRDVTEMHDQEKKTLEETLRADFLTLKNQLQAQSDRLMADIADRERLMRETFLTEAVTVVDQALLRLTGVSLPAVEIQKMASEVSQSLHSTTKH